MRALIIIENQFVEIASTRLLTHIGVHYVRTQLVQGNGVVQGFAAGLESEGYGDVTDGEPLAVDGADAHAPVVGVHARQLRDVACNLALRIGLAPPVELLDVLGEAGEVRDDKLVAEGPRDEDHVGGNHSPESLSVQLLRLRRPALVSRLVVQRPEVLAELGQARVVLAEPRLSQRGQEFPNRQEVVVFVLEHVEEDILGSLGSRLVRVHHVADIVDEGIASTGGLAVCVVLGVLLDAGLEVGEAGDLRTVEGRRLS